MNRSGNNLKKQDIWQKKFPYDIIEVGIVNCTNVIIIIIIDFIK